MLRCGGERLPDTRRAQADHGRTHAGRNANTHVQGALILKILRGKYPPVVGYSPDVSDVIKRCLTQNANRRPNTYKLLLLPCVRQKAEELGISVPDQQSLLAMAERSSTTKVRTGPNGAVTGRSVGLGQSR